MCRGRRSWGRPCWARSRTSVPLRLRWPPRGRRVRRRCSPPRSRREEGTGRARPGQLLIFGHILGHELLSCRSCGARSRSSGAGHEAGRRAFGRRRPDYGTDAIQRRLHNPRFSVSTPCLGGVSVYPTTHPPRTRPDPTAPIRGREQRPARREQPGAARTRPRGRDQGEVRCSGDLLTARQRLPDRRPDVQAGKEWLARRTTGPAGMKPHREEITAPTIVGRPRLLRPPWRRLPLRAGRRVGRDRHRSRAG
jgi:hypothetical protein